MVSSDYDSFQSGRSHWLSSYLGIPGLPELVEASLLDRCLLRIQEAIKSEGLKSLYWVTGVYTREIAASLLFVLSQQAETRELQAENCYIVVKPWENRLVESFSSRFGISVMHMQEFYDDSFLIVNEAALLDVTPAAADDGAPEFNDDPTVVSLYIGLFNMLKNRSVLV